MNKKFFLLLLFCASAQMQGMEQLVAKLKTKIRRTVYRVDKLWEEARYLANRSDDFNHGGIIELTGWTYYYPCKGDMNCVEKRLTDFYDKEVAFNRYTESLYDEVKKMQSELEKDSE